MVVSEKCPQKLWSINLNPQLSDGGHIIYGWEISKPKKLFIPFIRVALIPNEAVGTH